MYALKKHIIRSVIDNSQEYACTFLSPNDVNSLNFLANKCFVCERDLFVNEEAIAKYIETLNEKSGGQFTYICGKNKYNCDIILFLRKADWVRTKMFNFTFVLTEDPISVTGDMLCIYVNDNFLQKYGSMRLSSNKIKLSKDIDSRRYDEFSKIFQ